MKQSNKIVMLMGMMIDGTEDAIKSNPNVGKLLSIIGMAALMARGRDESSDEDAALASAIKMRSHHDLSDIRFELTEELESVALNVAPALSQFDLNSIRVLSNGIHLIDMVGELMVGEQEKEQINAVS